MMLDAQIVLMVKKMYYKMKDKSQSGSKTF
jgi:hypothetical protein